MFYSKIRSGSVRRYQIIRFLTQNEFTGIQALMIFVSQRVISGHILFFLPVMKKPAAALNLHLRSCSSTELLPLLLFCLFLSLSFPVHLVHSKSDTSNGEEPVQWQILTKNNFSSQVRLNPHILLIVTVPWSGESRSLMKELAHMVSKKKEEFKTLKLMLVYKNHDKMLAEALGATMETNIISYRHSLPYKYQGTFRVQSILSSAHYLMSLLPEELPFKSLQNAHDLTTFLESTDKAFLVLEFCGWTPKLMAKVMNNRSENAFGVPLVAGLHGQSSEPDGIKNKGIGNEKIQCDEFSGLPELGEFAPLNESDFMEAEKTRSTIDEASCSYEEFQLFESSLYNLTTSVRDFFLPPERLKFGLVSERSLISSLGVGDTSSWLMMVYSSGCPECAKVFKEGGDFKRIIEINSSPVMELKGDEYDLDPGLPSDRPTMVLFIDRSSDSLKIRRKSKEALNTFRQLALHNHTPSKTNPQKHLIASQHPKLEMTTSLQKVTALKDKIFLMAMKEGKHITIDDIASSLQGSSLQEVLTQLLQKKKEKKLSSLAKDVGFQLLSDDIDITVPDTDGTDVSSSVPSDDVDLTVTGTVPVTGVNCSFFFIDGQFRLLKHLSTVQKIPSLVIINPLSHQHYVYPQDSNFNFTYSDISNFLHMFLNGSLVPYQRSGSIVTNPKESPRPPFVNQDFHEVDSIPRVNALSFMELVVGNNNHSGLNNISWKKDVLVLFTSSWCGFCLRTELVVREVYQAFKNYGNLVKSQLKKVNLKLPVIYMIDCTENDCTSLLKSSTKRDLYPSLVLYPSESKEAISYDGETSVHNIIKFIADQGGDSHWIYKEQGILWTEPQQEQWNEKPLKEPILDSDVSFSHEILLKDRSDSGPHNSEPDNNNNIVSQTSVNEIKIQPGSILIATQKLQSIYPFAKSKILIVKVNTTTGFQGLIVNKHISWDTITRLEEGLDSLKEAPLSYGGPVIARELPLVSLTREIQPSGNNNNEYFEVLPDVYFLDQWATISLIQNLKLHNRSMTDYWFFVGYSSWGWAQLFDEIADGSWNVVDGTDHKFDWPMS